jgi:hypothetical protein
MQSLALHNNEKFLFLEPLEPERKTLYNFVSQQQQGEVLRLFESDVSFAVTFIRPQSLDVNCVVLVCIIWIGYLYRCLRRDIQYHWVKCETLFPIYDSSMGLARLWRT